MEACDGVRTPSLPVSISLSLHPSLAASLPLTAPLCRQIHGTYRRKDRIYREDIYYGKGKELERCTTEELSEEMQERASENAAAYQSEADKQQMLQPVQRRLQKPASQ